MKRWIVGVLFAAVAMGGIGVGHAHAEVIGPMLTGTWEGNSSVEADGWTGPSTLPFHLTIAEDGAVTGTVGNATLLHGSIGPEKDINNMHSAVGFRATHLSNMMGGGAANGEETPREAYVIHALLKGDLAQGQSVHPRSIKITVEPKGAALLGDFEAKASTSMDDSASESAEVNGWDVLLKHPEPSPAAGGMGQ